MIASHLQSLDINQAVFDLVEAAKTNGGHDNVTVIVVEIEKVPSVQGVESRDQES
jgi:serine/threonine protein phosphatase PrpC